MDGDDEIDPDMYRRLMDNARNCETDISHCGHRVRFLDGRESAMSTIPGWCAGRIT